MALRALHLGGPVGHQVGVGVRGRDLGDPALQPGPDLLGRVGAAVPLVAEEDGPGGRYADDPGDSEQLGEAHGRYRSGVAHSRVVSRPSPTALSLHDAVELTRTGDVWVFRGASLADRAIQTVTNAPVNHVGMAVVIEDLPPLLWHAELGHSLADVWSGRHQRGVQLHDLSDAVCVWKKRYGQQGWMRQLVGPADDGGVTREMEDAVLRTIARLDGKPFPTTRNLASGWVNGKVRRHQTNDTIFCAELVAATYTAMGLLPKTRPLNSYDPGSFWSGDDLPLIDAQLGAEIRVDVPAGPECG
jgi:hypothetical protein